MKLCRKLDSYLIVGLGAVFLLSLHWQAGVVAPKCVVSLAEARAVQVGLQFQSSHIRKKKMNAIIAMQREQGEKLALSRLFGIHDVVRAGKSFFEGLFNK